ncbi:MAG: Spo0E family sporulation regulatory protein-aspartic acid phosphatase, partial [Clostridiales bacterium]|nr:Spo0E family sporulation regulatory protein-aspartic acid phosphatase [Clostridiales bacterium]
MKIKDEIELLRELLNKAIEMEADTDEIIKISQMLDKQIVAYM